MQPKLSPGTGIVILIVVASCFAANHLSARIAFDHGASVAAAVAVRATSTALFLFFLLKILKVPFGLPAGTRGAALVAGVLIAVQSYTLYSAVAIIPPALALLVFQTSPMLYVLLTWAFGKQRPQAAALAPMLLALAGLALALDIRTDQLGARWDEIGVGVCWAFASGVSMAFVYFLNTNALAAIDGRLRTFVMTAVTASIVIVAAGSAGAMRFPADATGAAGLVSLTIFYCTAMIGLFWVLPRVPAAATAALNFEPIALLGLAWIFLDLRAGALQIVGAFITVGAIAWLSAMKK